MFHKKAKKHRWDVEKYNRIKQVSLCSLHNCRLVLICILTQGINTVELDLQKLRDPLQIHVPSARNEDKSHKSGGFFGITNLRDVINKLQ